MSYFLLYFNEDGVQIEKLSEKALLALFDEYTSAMADGEDPPEFLSAVPKDTNYAPSGSHLLIKGEIVVPRAVQVATRYEVD